MIKFLGIELGKSESIFKSIRKGKCIEKKEPYIMIVKFSF